MAMQISSMTFLLRVGMAGGSGIELDNFRTRIHVEFVSDTQSVVTVAKQLYTLTNVDDSAITDQREMPRDEAQPLTTLPRAVTAGELIGSVQAFLDTQEANVEAQESTFTHTATQNVRRLILLNYALEESRDARLRKHTSFSDVDSPAVPRPITGGELSGTLQGYIDGLEADIRVKEATL